MTAPILDAPQPTNGVLVVDGYGLRIAVQRQHLLIQDGSGRQRRERRLARVGHNLRRLVILGHSGTISLEAIRWLDRTGIQLVHIDTDGTPLLTSAHPGLNDARLRRAQAITGDSPVGLDITRKLLDAKLRGQATVAATHLDNDAIAERIDRLRHNLADVTTLAAARELEATAARDYFASWPSRVALTWATRDHVPEHWTRYQGRRSPLSHGSAIRAADPINALLNYLYALAEIECRLACLTLGLDPGLGFLHADSPARDSLALDLIEVVRPAVDAFTIDLADGHIFRAVDFTEREDGHCRILPPLTHHLARTLPTWAAEVAPWAEMVAHTLADASPRAVAKPTPLTSATRRATAAASSAARQKDPTTRRTRGADPARGAPGRLFPACADCGSRLTTSQRTYCPDCWPSRRIEAGQRGSYVASAALSDEARREARSTAISAGKAAARNRRAESLGHDPDEWLSEMAQAVYGLTRSEIVAATGLSVNQASRIKRGVQVPRPEQWSSLRRAVEARARATLEGTPTPTSR